MSALGIAGLKASHEDLGGALNSLTDYLATTLDAINII